MQLMPAATTARSDLRRASLLLRLAGQLVGSASRLAGLALEGERHEAVDARLRGAATLIGKARELLVEAQAEDRPATQDGS